MAYQELRKIYYKQPGQYEQMYRKYYSDPKVVQLNFVINGYPAFFIRTDEIEQKKAALSRLNREIADFRNKLPNIAIRQYTTRCLIDELVSTNRIEGIHSSRKEIGEVLGKLEEQSAYRKKTKRFWGIVNKYLKLLEQEDVQIQSCKDIRILYDELLQDEIEKADAPDGEFFRKGMVSVYSPSEKELHKGLYPEKKIIAAMEKALAVLQDTSIEPLYRNCLFHYMFEYIHPFYDGNGRFGRFILSAVVKKNLNPLLACRLSYTIKNHIKEYYQAFDSCNNIRNRGDMTLFLDTMLTILTEAAEDLKENLEDKWEAWNFYQEKVSRFFSDTEWKKRFGLLCSLLIQAALFSEEGIARQELQDYAEIGDRALRNRLKNMGEKELLIERRKGNQKYYEMNLKKIEEDLA